MQVSVDGFGKGHGGMCGVRICRVSSCWGGSRPVAGFNFLDPGFGMRGVQQKGRVPSPPPYLEAAAVAGTALMCGRSSRNMSLIGKGSADPQSVAMAASGVIWVRSSISPWAMP